MCLHFLSQWWSQQWQGFLPSKFKSWCFYHSSHWYHWPQSNFLHCNMFISQNSYIVFLASFSRQNWWKGSARFPNKTKEIEKTALLLHRHKTSDIEQDNHYRGIQCLKGHPKRYTKCKQVVMTCRKNNYLIKATGRQLDLFFVCFQCQQDWVTCK